MTIQSRCMLRISLIYLLIGAGLGALMLLNKAFPYNPAVWVWRPVHIQLMIWGFIIQFTLGMAYWILPRYLKGKARGNDKLSWVMVATLNLGIICSVGDSLSNTNYLSTTGLFFQLVAVVIFVFLHWRRATSYNK